MAAELKCDRCGAGQSKLKILEWEQVDLPGFSHSLPSGPRRQGKQYRVKYEHPGCLRPFETFLSTDWKPPSS